MGHDEAAGRLQVGKCFLVLSGSQVRQRILLWLEILLGKRTTAIKGCD